MDQQTRNQLCSNTAQILTQTPQHRKLALLWAGVAAGAGLLTTLISLLLGNGIAGTGGLAGMGARSMLSTVQTAVLFFTAIALPFWETGYYAAALDIHDNRCARPTILLEGFRRFGPVLRFFLLQGVIYFAIATLCIQVGGMLYTMTPLTLPSLERFVALMEQVHADQALLEDPAIQRAFLELAMPAAILCGVLMLALMIPVFYRLRMVPFLLLDGLGRRALRAILDSFVMMRKNCLSLFLLDLRFWWFYLAEVAISVLCYGDWLLEALGVPLPLGDQAASLLFYVLAMTAQVALYGYAKNQVVVTYAGFYRQLLEDL